MTRALASALARLFEAESIAAPSNDESNRLANLSEFWSDVARGQQPAPKPRQKQPRRALVVRL